MFCILTKYLYHTSDCYAHQNEALKQQEAQLSQIDRAMLRFIEYFAKSLKVIWYDSDE